MEQSSALVQAMPPLARTLVGLALLTGLRRGEVFALRWKNVSLEQRHLTVEEAVYEGAFGTPKTSAGLRRVPLSDGAVTLLTEWKQRARSIEPDTLLFSTWSGKPIRPENVLRRWVFPACDGLGLPRASWLTFRHTYASWAHEKGVPGKVVAQLMGHTNADVTFNVYTQVIDRSLREAVATVGKELITIDHKTDAIEGDARS